jgi:uncharacterized small protein (DUF1192 family)
MKKVCQYSKCGKEFTPNKPRQQYCSDVHRVYANREKKSGKNPISSEKVQAEIAKAKAELSEKEPTPKDSFKEKVILPGGTIAISNEEIRRQIAEVKARKKPEFQSEKSWIFDQNKLIKELESKLK